MKITSDLIFFVLFSASIAASIVQQNTTVLLPLPSINDFTKGDDGWAFGLGLGVEYESAYEGSDEFDLGIQPAGAIQWRSGNNIFYLHYFIVSLVYS